jgi:hypothetical protein
MAISIRFYYTFWDSCKSSASVGPRQSSCRVGVVTLLQIVHTRFIILRLAISLARQTSCATCTVPTLHSVKGTAS